MLPWALDPVLIGTLVTAAVVYWLLAGPLRSRVAASAPVSRTHVALFGSGIVIAFLTEASPLHELSDRYLLSAHMVQHLLLSYVVAPLLLAGTPGWMIRPFITLRGVEPVFRALTRPIVAFFIFSLGFSLWHLPYIYEAALQNDFVHHLQHVIYLVLSLIVWWPLMSPLREFPRLEPGAQIVYLVALPVGQFFAAALLTFASVAVYPTYVDAPRILGISAQADQQLGGIIMKIASFIAFGIPLVVVFMRWANREQDRYRTRPVPPADQKAG